MRFAITTVIVFLIIFLVAGKLVWAYIDPGTGSVIFGAVGYVIAAGVTFFLFAIKPFKILYRKIFKSGEAKVIEESKKDTKTKGEAEETENI